MPPRIVADTNVLISGFSFAGKPEEILKLVQEKKIQPIISSALIAELEEVVSKKSVISEGDLPRVREFIHEYFALVSPKKNLTIVDRDPDDNRVLEAAVEGDCEYIITGDRDLLDLKRYKNIKIVSPAEFLELI